MVFVRGSASFMASVVPSGPRHAGSVIFRVQFPQ